MAWATTDKEKLRKYLGFPLTDAALNVIQNRMDQVQGLSVDGVTTAQAYLSELDSISAAISSGRSTAAIADTASTTATSYFRGENLKVNREEAQRIVRELAALMSLAVCRDIFAVSSSSSGRRVSS